MHLKRGFYCSGAMTGARRAGACARSVRCRRDGRRRCYLMTPSDSAPAHVIVYLDHKYWHSSPAALMALLNSSTA